MNKQFLSLFAAAACALTTACSQIPWDTSAPDPAPQARAATGPDGLPFPASIPPAPRASVAAPAPRAVPAPAPLAKASEAKDIDAPRPVDLARPADDLWDRIRGGFAMEDLDSPLVGVRERWYASQPDYLQRMVERSKLYLYYIVEEVDKRGMPTEIALLPMVESAFNPMAYS
ncbi:MAG TPA: lytic transglycosylase, partial [Burkholderiales bacterium]|nr:lytic transglycosylase [Burkholderiales bacterium]